MIEATMSRIEHTHAHPLTEEIVMEAAKAKGAARYQALVQGFAAQGATLDCPDLERQFLWQEAYEEGRAVVGS